MMKNNSIRENSIRAVAYAIWENRVKTGAPGDEVSDWLTAERLVMAFSFYGDPVPQRPIGASGHRYDLGE